MEAVVNGKTIELSEAGWLLNLDEWNEELAAQIAINEKVPELTEESSLASLFELRPERLRSALVGIPAAFLAALANTFSGSE